MALSESQAQINKIRELADRLIVVVRDLETVRADLEAATPANPLDWVCGFYHAGYCRADDRKIPCGCPGEKRRRNLKADREAVRMLGGGQDA